MPQIPMYDGPQVSTRALNFDQANPDAFGAAQGRQLAQAGQGAMQMSAALDAINDREVQRELFDAEAKAKEGYLNWSKEQMTSRQGAAAKGIAEDSKKWWEQTQQDMAKNMSSPMAQRMFGRVVQQQSLAALSDSSRFETQQLELDLSQKTDATVDRSIKLAAQIPTPENIKQQQDAIVGALQVYGGKRWSPEVMAQKTEKAMSDLHVSVFNNLFVRDPIGAEVYFKENRNQIDARQYDSIEKQLKAGVADVVGGSAAREVFATTMEGKGYNDAIPADKMDAELVKRFEGKPEALKAARIELDRQVGLRNKAQAEQQAGAINSVYEAINKGASPQRAPGWSMLSEQAKQGITQQITDRNHMLWARSIEDKNRIEHERQLRYAPAMLIYSQPENISKMTREGIINLMPEIGVQNANTLLTTWQSYQNNQAKLSQATVDNDAFKSVLAGAGIDPNPKHTDKEGSKRVLDLRTQVELTIGQRQQERKGELTAAEKLKAMQDAVYAKVLTPGTLYGFNETPVYEATPEQLAKSSVKVGTGVSDPKTGRQIEQMLPLSSIPVNEYGAVEKQLRREGRSTTPADVAQAWFDFQQKKKGLK